MSTYPTPGGFGRSIEEAMERIEAELRQAVAYVNDAVVPQVRRESIAAMRTMADMLRNLADRVEASGRPGAPPPNPPPNPPNASRPKDRA
jgi:hypothetical protein